MCLFIIATATASTLEEDFQDRSLRTNYSQKEFHFPQLGQCQDQYKTYSHIRVCDMWGLTCFSELDISIIMWYQNYVLSIFTQLHIFTYNFGKVVVTTALCIFSVVIATATHWRLLVYYVYFWSCDHHHQMLGPVYNHCQGLSVLFIFCRHHD